MSSRKLHSESEIKAVIRKCLSTDCDLVQRRHSSPIKTLNGCTEYTYDVLFNNEDDISFFQLLDNGVTYGFIAVCFIQNSIRSFFINKKHRENGFCDKFWVDVRSIVKPGFLILVWPDNERAERFFINEGGVVHFRGDDVLIYYIE